jgi:hypothetical protein
MAAELRIKTKSTDVDGHPGGTGNAGNLALNAQASAKSKNNDVPKLFASDGSNWYLLNPQAPVTVGTADLGAGKTPGASTGIGAAWTAKVPKPSGSIIIVSYGGTAFVKTGAGGGDGDWTGLGSATQFASDAEVKTGTNTGKAVNPKGLASFFKTTPDVTPANDAGYSIVLDATGKIDAGFLSIKGLTYRGNQDITGTYTPISGIQAGDFATASAAGNSDASWTGITAATKVEIGDLVIWDGSAWHLVEHGIDTSAYLPFAGGTMVADAKIDWPGAATAEAGKVLLDLKGGTIDQALIDCGTY